MSADLDEYTLWLLPEEKMQNQLRTLVETITGETKTVVFEPHMTLLGGLHLEEALCIEKMQLLAGQSQSFTAEILKPEMSDAYYRSLYLRCEPSPQLLTLYENAQKLFNAHGGMYMPHISVMYGDVAEGLKENALRVISDARLPQVFVMESLALYHAKGGADSWKCVSQIPLTHQ